ncbi:AUGMIN subunit 6 [Camellia lanceoleosa]|uniref:AUGMIN subunit 6 n=1 Tax=Camellia lanceoleosa TaxID=1840588 RepID=A0ACC0HTQ7_9ERIC|nr:AUGMIN subunit 6 [Camellia lanceoleosa]
MNLAMVRVRAGKWFSFSCWVKFDSSNSQKSYCDREEAQDQVFLPPLLMGDPYEDLLAPLSEIETALMEC